MANADLKAYAISRGVRLWQVADAWQIMDGSLSRKLRHEFDEQEKARFKKTVDAVAAENEKK